MISVSDRLSKDQRKHVPGSLEAWKCRQCSAGDSSTQGQVVASSSAPAGVATTTPQQRSQQQAQQAVSVIDLTEDSDDDILEISAMDVDVGHDARSGIDAGFSRLDKPPHVISTGNSPQGPDHWQEQPQEQPRNTVVTSQDDMRYREFSQSRFQPYIPNQSVGAAIHSLEAAEKEHLRNLFPPTRATSSSTSCIFLSHTKSPPSTLAEWIAPVTAPKPPSEGIRRPRKALNHRNESELATLQLVGLGNWQSSSH
jgi:hypothetical protein